MTQGLAEGLQRFRGLVFSKYLIASGIALFVDMALFIQLIALSAVPAVASAVAYSVGIAVHWALSSRIVFPARVALARRRRTVQQTQFVASALIGLAITTAIVTGGSHLGLDPRLAKLIAVGVSFLTVWHLRNNHVFRPQRRDPASSDVAADI